MAEQPTTQVAFRIVNDLLEKLDRYVNRLGEEQKVRVNRTFAVQKLLAIGLEEEEKKFIRAQKELNLMAWVKNYGFKGDDNFMHWFTLAGLIVQNEGIDLMSAQGRAMLIELASPGIRDDLQKAYSKHSLKEDPPGTFLP